jgi:hypothetical protein
MRIASLYGYNGSATAIRDQIAADARETKMLSSKCTHQSCQCIVVEGIGERFCSTYCEEATKRTAARSCQCNHGDCHGPSGIEWLDDDAWSSERRHGAKSGIESERVR